MTDDGETILYSTLPVRQSRGRTKWIVCACGCGASFQWSWGKGSGSTGHPKTYLNNEHERMARNRRRRERRV